MVIDLCVLRPGLFIIFEGTFVFLFLDMLKLKHAQGEIFLIVVIAWGLIMGFITCIYQVITNKL